MLSWKKTENRIMDVTRRGAAHECCVSSNVDGGRTCAIITAEEKLPLMTKKKTQHNVREMFNKTKSEGLDGKWLTR